MAKLRRPRQNKTPRGSPRPKSPPADPAAGPDLSESLIDAERHRFPWPADPRRRYGLESPYLAVVNARGPWAVWKHGRANPPFIPLCLDLLDKDFWRRATNDQRVFAVTCWLRAAREDDWGIVWGDPVRLVHEWGLDPATFTARLDWLIGAGLACYLTAAEAEAVRSWSPYRARGGNTRGGQEQARQEQAEQGQDQARQGDPSPADLQGSSPRASAQQIPDSKGQGQEQAQQSKSQHRAQGQPQGTEPANLPKSDHGAAGGPPRTQGGVRGQTTHGRPQSAPLCPEATPLGDLLGWGNPSAVEFGRGMYEAITGHAPPADLTTAADAVKADVGVWVHYWAKQVEPSLEVGRRAEFADRCYRDVAKKRKVRSIRNLGRVAMAKIVPGILAAMRLENA